VEITVELPNDLDQHPEPAREAVEALAIAGYRSGKLTAFQASRILGCSSRFEFEGLLKERNVLDHAYSAEDLEADVQTLHRLDPDSANRVVVVADVSPLNYLIQTE
jgi:predicted HTH domain antitoxin